MSTFDSFGREATPSAEAACELVENAVMVVAKKYPQVGAEGTKENLAFVAEFKKRGMPAEQAMAIADELTEAELVARYPKVVEKGSKENLAFEKECKVNPRTSRLDIAKMLEIFRWEAQEGMKIGVFDPSKYSPSDLMRMRVESWPGPPSPCPF